ncbi:Serine/threonine-protein kinase 40 [Pleodorina starrii]|uniref:Serine/threonine-protein kinase 40 n=1 Tax=Pleodorina starrii TaxID=330485 RepID=A0A9W6F2W1_9CHLO|nr:Serine/threonine-protein kinase 40 [Pleodorina starrii]GLC54643.1 Serine/threonine-protein kinase 40 [Pleodorina starrii]GLC66982.1 Serine/threonine-protein kinase 40 [Pleodorina starrii]
MGACMCKGGGDDRCADGSRRDPSRRRSRTGYGPGSNRSCFERGGSNHYVPPPDFGVASHYRVMELLGEGGTGQTWMCQDLKSHQRVAIKFIPRPLPKVLVPMVSQEIQLQAQLSEGHLGLVRVESALLSKTHLGLVMEYVDGGTLTRHVMRRADNKAERGGLHLVEDEARYFFRQLIAAVEYLHASHVAHRDLKMCNVVLTQRRPPTLKLCDFGFAKGWDESSMMATRIGTPVYMSPQLIKSKSEGKTYSATAADVWACGVMLFAMLLGRFPYDHVGHPDPNSSGAHLEVLEEQMKANNGDWRTAPRVAPHINLLSDECKDLLGKMLEPDERQRITIPDIRKHAWFSAELPPYLDEAMQDFEQRQARLAKVMEAAAEAQIKRRNKAVHDLIVLAGQPYNPVEPSSGSKRLGSGAISAVFEVGTEVETSSVGGGSSGAAHSRTLMGPASPRASPETDSAEAQQRLPSGMAATATAAAAAGAFADAAAVPERAASSRTEPDVIMIELAAVARRTKSDGLVLMAGAFDPDPDAAEAPSPESGRNCESEESEAAVDSSSGDAAATTVGGGGGGSTPDASAAAGGGGGGEEGDRAASDGRTLTATAVTCEAGGTVEAAAVADDAGLAAPPPPPAKEEDGEAGATHLAAAGGVGAAIPSDAVAVAQVTLVPTGAAAEPAVAAVAAAERAAAEPAVAAAAGAEPAATAPVSSAVESAASTVVGPNGASSPSNQAPEQPQ